jgi:polyisoprenoid-binding protein YceI
VGRLTLGILLAALASASATEAPPHWQIDYSASRLGFVAEQAGAAFSGAFARFEADVRFAPDALDASSARVRIVTASVATEDDERDSILRGAGWFESAAFAEAVFDATSFVATQTGFRASGTLTVRETTAPVTFDFALTNAGLRGTAELDRFALGLGLGDWADESWIGRTVRVEVELVRAR